MILKNLKPISVLVAALLLFSGGFYLGNRWSRSSGPEPEKAFIPPESHETKDLPHEVVETKIVALKPTSRVLEAVKEVTGLTPTGRIISVRDIQALCNGGKLLLTLEPVDVTKPDGSQNVVPTIIPNKPPFFGLDLRTSLSVSYGQSFVGSGRLNHRYGRIEISEDILHLGKIELFARAGAIVGQDFSYGYVEGGARVTF